MSVPFKIIFVQIMTFHVDYQLQYSDPVHVTVIVVTAITYHSYQEVDMKSEGVWVTRNDVEHLLRC